MLPAAIGQTRALRLLLQDETIDAETALDWGLVTEVADDPGARAAEIARFWLENATAAFGQAKRLLRAGARRAVGLAGVAPRAAAALPVLPALAFFAGGCAS